MVIVIMGVSGTGKTTVGKELAKQMNCEFYDGDDFHPERNKEKMRNKIPLNDNDRRPWLMELRKLSSNLIAEGNSGIIACSALKNIYRKWLGDDLDGLSFVFLNGSYETIEQRMKVREGHYMPVSLLKSQFETLEEPTSKEALWVSIELPVERIVQKVLKTISPAQ